MRYVIAISKEGELGSPFPRPVAWARRPGPTTAWVAVVVRKPPTVRTCSGSTVPPRARPVAKAPPTRRK
jgi:hypothetical protein